MKIFNILIVCFITIQLSAQIAPDIFYVQFTDKANSPYSLNNPEAFLSQRAIERRQKQQIQYEENDLPVNPAYLQGVAQTGATLLFPTKWLNGVTVNLTDPSILNQINSLPYVVSVRQLSNHSQGKIYKVKDYFANEYIQRELPQLKLNPRSGSYDYGNGYIQINQINGIPLHEAGFRGQGMVIAVIDAGFVDADTHIAFDSLRNEGRLLGVKDFVHPGGNVYTESSHGTSVLSTMAANVSGQLIGTAPKASYYLLRSEYVYYEQLVEEFNWASAAEYADSLGVDVINSSLGYIDFDYPQWTHSYEDMDGQTCPATKAANVAASKGILVVNSAGNSGSSNTFPYMGAPADGEGVFSIGAVTSSGTRASFSSIGPTSDGRIKPDVMAMGQQTALANGNNNFTYGSGTSFSSPVIAGMSACLWQSRPTFTSFEIREAIRMSADKAANPDNFYGYGIPDYTFAGSLLASIDIGQQQEKLLVRITPNPFVQVDKVELLTFEKINVSILDVKGSKVRSLSGLLPSHPDLLRQTLNNLKAGFYVLELRTESAKQVLKIVKTLQ
ncbi:MAG: S8 family serine peptidase [Bacteroidales bacterium]|nr:S8 family serine peptidase [Bacteroidales bacterium]